MAKAILLTFLFSIICFSDNCFADEGEPDWQKISEGVEKMLRTEVDPTPAGPLFVHESGMGQRWCFIGDTGNASVAQEQVNKVLIQKGSCNKIFHAGDIVYPIGIRSAKDKELSKKFLNYYSPFAVPFYLSIGNHEYYSLKIKPWLELPALHPNLKFPHFYYGYDFDGMCIVAGDTTPFDVGDARWPKAAAQSKWLTSVVSEMSKCQFRIFLAHHPFRSPSKVRPVKQKITNFYNTHVVGKYDLVVNGHDHVLAYMGNAGGTEFLISGSGGNYNGSHETNEIDYSSKTVFSGPGILYVDVLQTKPLSVKATFVVLEGRKFDTPKPVWEKVLTGR